MDCSFMWIEKDKKRVFLDQQDNRRAIQHIVKDADVLGAFTYRYFEYMQTLCARSVLGLDIQKMQL